MPAMRMQTYNCQRGNLTPLSLNEVSLVPFSLQQTAQTLLLLPQAHHML